MIFRYDIRIIASVSMRMPSWSILSKCRELVDEEVLKTSGEVMKKESERHSIVH